MNQILSTTYLVILLCFLSLFSYYISNEVLKNLQEENIFNILNDIEIENENKTESLLHFNLVKVYTKKNIFDAALYEAQFLIKSSHHSYSNIIISNLYELIGQNYEKIEDYNAAVKYYSKATVIHKDNQLAYQGLTRLTER